MKNVKFIFDQKYPYKRKINKLDKTTKCCVQNKYYNKDLKTLKMKAYID